MADSDSLFYLKGQFYLGAYKAVAQNPVPPKDSPDYLPTLLYTARSHIALNKPSRALQLVEADTEPSVRAVRALANYIKAKSLSSEVDGFLDELRDLAIEAEAGADDYAGGEGTEEGAGIGVVRVAAATAFVQEGELEEALTTLGAGSGPVKDLECLYLVVQIYLSISRVDLAKKEYTLTKSQPSVNSDALLLALIEAALGLVQGGTPLISAYHIFDEQVSAPGSSTNARIGAAKGVVQLLRGHLSEATSSFDESLGVDPSCGDALVGRSVAKLLAGKQAEADEAFNALKSTLPSHPYVQEVDAKSSLFDQLKAQYTPSVTV